MHEETRENNFMMKIATFIVDKRNVIFLLFILLIVFSVFSAGWVEVENDLVTFLPDNSDSKQGLDIMEEQFTTYGTAEVMVANITYDEALEIKTLLEDLDGIQSITFDETSAHFSNASALYSVTFSYDERDDQCLEALDLVRETLKSYDLYIATELGNSTADIIDAEVQVIMVVVAIVVVAVLLLTSQTYAEIPVLLLTFLAAMITNTGTNFLLGKISFVSNSVTSILQLALSLDYAVILCNRYKEEHETLPIYEAIVVALSKAIPEIASSSLTTIGGLVAMMFMQFKIGPDMGICLIKSILFALISVFTLMPGLLMLFGKWMDKTRHKSFVPKIPFVGKYAYLTRYVVPILFIGVLCVACYFSNQCPYVYGYCEIETPRQNEVQEAENMIAENFSSTNFVALVIPQGDYASEKALLSELESYEEVDYAMGLSNVEAMDGYTLTDQLTPRQFSELADLDYEIAQILYAGYATEHGEETKIVSGLSSYSVPLIDMFLYVCDQVDAGLVTLDPELSDMLSEAKEQMTLAKVQLQGTEFCRMLIYLTLPESGQETYDFLDTIKATAEKYYPDRDIYLVGNSTSEYDFKKSFSQDNIVVSILSILIVLVVLLFTFKSAGMPVLLILVIQGAIWINFSIPALTGDPLFFMSYLVVSAIQMGANIDYAIVIANRFMELEHTMPRKEAIIETMNFAFPTIITSGTILATAGMLIGNMTSEAAIVGIGQSLGRGTIISIILVMFVLPQILLFGSRVVEKTSFIIPKPVHEKTATGRIAIDGMVYGYISGRINGSVRGIVDGDVNVKLISGSVVEEEEHEEDD